MQRFTPYSQSDEIRMGIGSASPENPCVVDKCGAEGQLCMGCNELACEKHAKSINGELYCDNCRVCCCCGEPAIMDDGNGLVCSPSRVVEPEDHALDCPRRNNIYPWDCSCGQRVICNGSLQDAEDEAGRIFEARDQLDWDNGAYQGGSR